MGRHENACKAKSMYQIPNTSRVPSHLEFGQNLLVLDSLLESHTLSQGLDSSLQYMLQVAAGIQTHLEVQQSRSSCH